MDIRDFARVYIGTEMEKDAFLAKGLGFLAGAASRGAGALAKAPGSIKGVLAGSMKKTKDLAGVGYYKGLKGSAAKSVKGKSDKQILSTMSLTKQTKARAAANLKGKAKDVPIRAPKPATNPGPLKNKVVPGKGKGIVPVANGSLAKKIAIPAAAGAAGLAGGSFLASGGGGQQQYRQY